MITLRKVQIYKKYDGDSDDFARNATQQERAEIKEAEWLILDSIIQDMELAEKGLLHEKNLLKLNILIQDNFENESVVIVLKGMMQ